MKLTMTIPEAAQYTGWSKTTIREWVTTGQVEYYKLKHDKHIYIPIVELNRMMKEGK